MAIVCFACFAVGFLGGFAGGFRIAAMIRMGVQRVLPADKVAALEEVAP